MSGVRAEVAVSGPSNCPVAALSAESEEPVTDVTWSRAGETFTEEFRVDTNVAEKRAAALADADPVLEVGDEQIYQFQREAASDATCACEVVESLGHPLADVRVEGGDLVMTLHLPGVERLQEVVSDLEAVAEGVEIRYLVHASADADGEAGTDRTVVDRGRLTERQREVLATAYEMGYFEYPRGANATEVAEALDVGLSAFAEHLAAAQGKLLSETLTV